MNLQFPKNKSNKGRRFELTMLKYKKRLNQLGFKEGEGKFYAYRSHGKPCSCWLCRNEKYKKNGKHRGKILEKLSCLRSGRDYLPLVDGAI
ncbi:MAG: hypothetical protein M3R36_05880 [Bacteroidota bacterium]|nr:hypothetical protein [Bacteroidota bacterium]